MRKSYILLILCTLLITIALLLAACAKTGSKGATGPAGPQGPAGAQGAPGPAGSQILSGSTPPTPTAGNPGDYYFDNVTDSLYGPMTSTGWGPAVSLRGSAGAAGPRGLPGTANVIYYNWTSFNDLAWGLSITTGYVYRIILIPGGVLGTSVDPHSLTYKEVCTKYSIQP